MMVFGPARAIKKRYAELNPKLYRLAWSWCHNTHMAQDLVQETWARALACGSQLRDVDKLLPWLSRIMVNLYRDNQRRMHDDLDFDQLELSGDDGTLENLGRIDDIERVRNAVAQLPAEQRMVLTLVDLMEFSYSQVADTLEVPIGTVMSRLSRSRQRLRELLETGERQQMSPGLRSVK